MLSSDEETMVSSSEATTAVGAEPLSIDGEILFDRYRVLGRLGRGGMGQVLKVLDTKINEIMALKLIKPEVAGEQEVLDRFRNELKLARRVAHRNVCRMFDFDDSHGAPYITMEYVPGDDLARILAESGPLPIEQAVKIGRAICDGLGEAHRLNVIHRDLKPGNIMIDPDGEARIMDFGLARHSEAPQFTRLGTMLGTGYYMSPEQIEGRDVDHRADIYSFGVMLFEMVAGARPFVGDSALAVAVKHKTEPPPDPTSLNPKVPAGLSRIILRCLEKDRDSRYQQIEDVNRDLTWLDAGDLLPEELAVSQLPAFLATERPTVEGPREEVFAGRQAELETLDGFLASALQGHGRVAFITGEPGSGKTVLSREFTRRALAAHPGLVVAGGRCSAHTGVGSPYLPFREVLDLVTGDIQATWAAGQMSRTHAERLWSLLPVAVTALLKDAPDLVSAFVKGPALLRRGLAAAPDGARWLERLKQVVDQEEGAPPVTLQEADIHDQFSRFLGTVSESAPLVLVLDDLQWADSGSISLLFHLGRQLANTRLLILGTYRSADLALGRGGDRHPLAEIVNEFTRDFGDLEIPLDKTEGRLFLDEYIDSEPNRLGPDFRETLFQRTGGHALFTVELLRDMQERGMLYSDDQGLWAARSELDWKTLPGRTEGVIAERLERLPASLLETLTVASVEGDVFTAEVLAEIRGTDTRDLIKQLSGELDRRHRLVKPLGVRRIGGQRISQYRFRHVLFQRYLYAKLDEAEVSYLHEDVAAGLERIYGEQRADVAVALALHFHKAGVHDKVFEYRRVAGERALHLSAFVEGISHLRGALECLDQLDESSELRAQELQVLVLLSSALSVTEGYSAREVERTYARARRICERPGEIPQGVPLIYGLWTIHCVRADPYSISLADQVQALAERTGEPTELAVAAFARGVSAFFDGNQRAAGPLLTEAAEAYDAAGRELRSLTYGFGDPLYLANLYKSWNLVLIGCLDQGWECHRENLSLAERLEDPVSLAMALCFSAALGHDLGRAPEEIGAAADRASSISDESGLPFWKALADIWLGWSRAHRGARDGTEQIEAGIALLGAMNAANPVPANFVALAEAHCHLGDVDKGLAAVESALSLSAGRPNCFFDAEAQRLRGDLFVLDSAVTAAEKSYRRSFETARGKGQRLFELRAALGLARLLLKSDRAGEARELLQPVSDAFPEGEKTRFPREARALLAELS